AETTFLPGRDDRLDRVVVGKGCTRLDKGEAPAGALAAAGDGPGGGRPAARAERPGQPRERVQAVVTNLCAGPPADDAALRQQQLEQHASEARRAKRTPPWLLRGESLPCRLEGLGGADVVPLTRQGPNVERTLRVQ